MIDMAQNDHSLERLYFLASNTFFWLSNKNNLLVLKGRVRCHTFYVKSRLDPRILIE